MPSLLTTQHCRRNSTYRKQHVVALIVFNESSHQSFFMPIIPRRTLVKGGERGHTLYLGYGRKGRLMSSSSFTYSIDYAG